MNGGPRRIGSRVRIESVAIFVLEIPFAASFTHATKRRVASDAFVCRVRGSDGSTGYGEGLARPYVTGETTEGAVTHVIEQLWPSIAGVTFEPISTIEALAQADDALTPLTPRGVLAAHASRAALEVAMIDCLLRAGGRSLADVLPPLRPEVTYSGVVSAETPRRAADLAARMAAMGLEHLKVKVGTGNDVERVAAVAEATGGAPLRVDANGAWSVEEAVIAMAPLESLGVVESIEAPVRRTSVEDLRRFRAATDVPVVADEYLVTEDDARSLVDSRACDVFNVRVSKCGGLWRSWRIAQMALAGGLDVQVGAQVGETAILSAAGRHLAAALERVRFVEGSFGTFLLAQDVATKSIAFGPGGRAPVLAGPGLGIEVDETILEKHAVRRAHCS